MVSYKMHYRFHMERNIHASYWCMTLNYIFASSNNNTKIVGRAWFFVFFVLDFSLSSWNGLSSIAESEHRFLQLNINRNFINLIALQYKILLSSSNFEYIICKIFFILQITKSGLVLEWVLFCSINEWPREEVMFSITWFPQPHCSLKLDGRCRKLLSRV